MDDSIDACRYIPICKNESFIQADVDDVCDEALQKPKTSNFSTETVNSVSMNIIPEAIITATNFQVNQYIGGIGSGIRSVSKGWYNISTMDCTTISVPMFYAPNGNEMVISPTDVVNTYPNKYDSVLQNFDVVGNCSQLNFYKKDEPYPSHIHSCENKMQFFMKEEFHYTAILLVKYNNLYNIDEPIISTIYRTSLQNMTLDFIHVQLPLCYTIYGIIGWAILAIRR